MQLLNQTEIKEMKTPHHKAYEYHYYFVGTDGIPYVAKNYIAVVPGVDIEMLVKRWNLSAGHGRKYVLKGEVDLKTALYKRGVSGGTIANDWQLLDHMQFHGIEFEVKQLAAA